MGVADRDVRINLQVNAEGNATAKLRELNDAAKRAATSTSSLGKSTGGSSNSNLPSSNLGRSSSNASTGSGSIGNVTSNLATDLSKQLLSKLGGSGGNFITDIMTKLSKAAKPPVLKPVAAAPPAPAVTAQPLGLPPHLLTNTPKPTGVAQAAEGKAAQTAASGARVAAAGEGAAAGLSSVAAAAGPAAIAVAAVVAAWFAAAAAADRFADFANIMNNSSATTAQKMNQLAEEFIPGFSSFRKLREAVDGTTERMRVSQLMYEQESRRISAEGEARGKISSAKSELSSATNRAVVQNAFQLPASQSFDRSTVAGEQQQSDADRRQEAKDSVDRANNERIAAGKDLRDQKVKTERERGRSGGTDRRIAESDARIKALQDIENGNVKSDRPKVLQAAGAAAQLGQLAMNPLSALPRMMGFSKEPDFAMELATGNKAPERKKGELDQELKKRKLLAEEQGTNAARLEAEITKEMEKQKNLKQAESNLRKESINAAKVELEILKDREQRMASAQTRLGQMNRGQFELAKQAATQLKEIGIENATSEMIDLARQVAPKMVDKLAEGAGGGRAKELAEAGIDDYATDYAKGVTLEEIRKRVDKVKTDVRVDIQLDATQTATDIAKAIDPLVRELIKAIQVQVEIAVDGVKQGQRERQNAEK